MKPHDVAFIRHGVGRYKPNAERLARFLATHGRLDLELANGQRVVVRPLPDRQRWRRHVAGVGADEPQSARGHRVEVQLRRGGPARFGRAHELNWAENGPHTITRWRPA